MSAVYDDDRAHVFHSWSAQATLDPVVVAGGSGSCFWDEAGRRYLDFSSQLVNLNVGHQHPAVVAAIQEQAATLTTVAPSSANAARSELARRLAELAPGALDMVVYTNSCWSPSWRPTASWCPHPATWRLSASSATVMASSCSPTR